MSSSSTTGSGHKRHHAKALLHPMTLLLRRRSGQSSSGLADHPASGGSYHLSSGKFGPTRDLPDDFDPGIIYGTRQHDWSSPRRSNIPGPSSIRDSSAQSQFKSVVTSQPSNSVPPPFRERQALFTEHFGDIPKARSAEETLPEPALHQQESHIPTPKREISPYPPRSNFVPTHIESAIDIVHDHTEPDSSLTYPENTKSSNPITQSENVLLAGESSDEIAESNDNDIVSASPLHLQNNSSRFSFEASSLADSIQHEELSLSENVIAKKSHRHYESQKYDNRSDSGSFDSEDVQSIQSEDLRGEDDDGFETLDLVQGQAQEDSAVTTPWNTASISLAGSIAPPPGFEKAPINALENVRKLQELSLDINIETSTSSAGLKSPPILHQGDDKPREGSLDGTDGSITGTDDEDPEVDLQCPPFINPKGAGEPLANLLEPILPPLTVNNLQFSQATPYALPFTNTFQTNLQGVGEYESGSPSSLGAGLLNPSPYTDFESTGFDDYELPYEDDDDMIAEANRDALASDNDGWYGQEFNFYPASTTAGSYIAGGFFGIDLPKPSFIRNPALTPISERSESSLRNSLNLVNATSFTNSGGVSAGPLSAALLAELANTGQISYDESALAQFQTLNGTSPWQDGPGSSLSFTSGPLIASRKLSNDTFLAGSQSFNSSVYTTEHPSAIISPLKTENNQTTTGGIITKYIYDQEMG